MTNGTGYESRMDNGSRWNRLCFNGDETKYKILETKFLSRLRTIGVKDAIFSANLSVDERDTEKKEEAYTELIQSLDDKSLLLIMREALDSRRKALRILHLCNS